MNRHCLWVATVAAALGAPCGAWADETAVVVRDAATGALRAPTAAEAAELRAKSLDATHRSAAQPQLRQLPDGVLVVTLPESMRSYLVARRRADGTLQRECAEGEDQARAAMQPAFAERATASPATGHSRGTRHEDR